MNNTLILRVRRAFKMGNYLKLFKYLFDESIPLEVRSLIKNHLGDIRIFAYRNLLKS